MKRLLLLSFGRFEKVFSSFANFSTHLEFSVKTSQTFQRNFEKIFQDLLIFREITHFIQKYYSLFWNFLRENTSNQKKIQNLPLFPDFYKMSHGIRGSTLTTLRSNVENEAGNLRGKTNAVEMAKGRVTRTRAAMTDIGNKTNILPASKNIQNKG